MVKPMRMAPPTECPSLSRGLSGEALAGHLGNCWLRGVGYENGTHPGCRIGSVVVDLCTGKSNQTDVKLFVMDSRIVDVLESWCRYLDFVGLQALHDLFSKRMELRKYKREKC
jgi:hypothetical protein